MAVRRLFILALLLAAACSNHGSSPAAPPTTFFTSQRAWCTVEAGGVAREGTDQYAEIYLFGKDGVLNVSQPALNDAHQLQWDENALLKTEVHQTAVYHVSNQEISWQIGKHKPHYSTYLKVQQKRDGQNVTCFKLTAVNTVHCPCAVSEVQ